VSPIKNVSSCTETHFVYHLFNENDNNLSRQLIKLTSSVQRRVQTAPGGLVLTNIYFYHQKDTDHVIPYVRLFESKSNHSWRHSGSRRLVIVWQQLCVLLENHVLCWCSRDPVTQIIEFSSIDILFEVELCLMYMYSDLHHMTIIYTWRRLKQKT